MTVAQLLERHLSAFDAGPGEAVIDLCEQCLEPGALGFGLRRNRQGFVTCNDAIGCACRAVRL